MTDYSSSLSGDRPEEVERIKAKMNGAPIPPNLWEKGSLLVSVWNVVLNRYEAWLADEEGTPVELAEWEMARQEAEVDESEDEAADVREQREFIASKRMDAIPLVPKSQPMLTKFLPPDGNTIWWADGGAGKSMLAEVVGVSLAAGIEVIPGCPPTVKPMRVLFLDYEDRPNINRRRLANLHAGELPNLFYHLPEFPLTTDAGVVEVMGLTKRLGIEFLIIDSVSWAVHADLIDPSTPKAFKDALQRIGLPSLSLFHVPKQSDLTSPYGSAFWKNAFIEGWSMERIEDESGHVILMRSHKETEGQPGKVLAFKVNWGGYDDEGDPVEDITVTVIDPVGLAGHKPGNPHITAQNKASARRQEYREAIVMACPMMGKAYTKAEVGKAVSESARMRGKEPPHRNTIMEVYRQLELEGVIDMPSRLTIRRLRDLDAHDEFIEPVLGL